VHAVVTESKEHDKLVFPKTVKLLHEYKGTSNGICNQQEIESTVKSIGNDVLNILTMSSNIMHALTEHKDWWQRANDLHSQIPPCTESNNAVFILDENVVGCHHTTCTIGTGFQNTSPVHTDTQSASANWAGLPDFHINLSENKNIGFLHYVVVGQECVQPILVIQDRLTMTFFYGASTAHGTVHIGTYLDKMNVAFEVSGNRELVTEVRPEWKVPAELGEQRVYATYYTKRTLPVTCEIQKAYSLMRVAPRFFYPIKGGGKGQVAEDRNMNAIAWDSHLIGRGAKSVNKMRRIQCNSYDDMISSPYIKVVDEL
jgi:hypothetical protein